MNASGEVSPIKINKSLSTFRDTNPGRLGKITSDAGQSDFSTFPFSPYFLNYFAGNFYSPLFGIGNGLLQAGECRVDEDNQVIVLSPAYTYPDIILKYISSPVKNDDYQIEIVCQEAVISFIEWKMKLGTEESYYARLREARRKMDP